MKTKMKALALALCAVMLVATTVFVTVAYLTSTTETVTNTFTVGNVVITLDEADVNEDGRVLADESGNTLPRVTENEYKLMPGHYYLKDPIVHVADGSENCWLFVKVVNEIAAIEDSEETVASQMADNGWSLVAGQTNIYAYQVTVNANSNIQVFNSFKIAGTVENDTLASYEGKTITVQAYAVQADGFSTAAAAWEAAPLNDWLETTAGN